MSPTLAAGAVEKIAENLYAGIDNKMLLASIATTLTLVVLELSKLIISMFKKKNDQSEEILLKLVDSVTRIETKLETIDDDIKEKAELVVHRELKARGLSGHK